MGTEATSFGVPFLSWKPKSSNFPEANNLVISFFHYGGDYKAYLRFYLSSNLQNLQIASPSAAIKDYSLVSSYGFTEIGFWNTTPAQSQTTLTLSYSLPPSSAPYTLILLKQHSFVSSPQTIRYQNQTTDTPLINDFVFTP